MKKKIVYIAHQLNAPTYELMERNRANAAKWVAWAAMQGVAPSATWIVLTGELSEEHRDLGLAIDCALVERCDEVWLVGPRISEGMRIEALHAHRRGIRVVDLTGFELPPEGATLESLREAAREALQLEIERESAAVEGDLGADEIGGVPV